MRSVSVPEAVTRLAASEGMWLPDPPADGWFWLTLEEMLDSDVFDELIESVSRETASPAVGFAVFDGDSSYLIAAGPDESVCRLIFDEERYDTMYEGQFPPAAKTARGGAKAFANWSSSFAPVGVAAAAVRRFCKEPDPLDLLVAAGLYPPPKPSKRPAWEDWRPHDMHGAGPRRWDGGGHSYLEGAREFAILPEPATDNEGPPGPWILFVGRDTMGFRPPSWPVEAYLTFTTMDRCYDLRGEFETVDEATRHFGTTYHGRPIREWKQIPDDVGRSRAQTIARLLEVSVDGGDWRLTGHHDHLRRATIVHSPYRTRSKWLEDCCSFCSATFVDASVSEVHAELVRDDPSVQTEGYAATDPDAPDDSHWICTQCFKDLHQHFDWRVVQQKG